MFVTFRVERVFKGAFGPVANVVIDKAVCGFGGEIGSSTGLFLEGGPSTSWQSNLCLQVDADHLLAAARSSFPPDPAIEPIGPIARGPKFPLWAVGLALGGVIAGSAIALIRHRRRSAA